MSDVDLVGGVQSNVEIDEVDLPVEIMTDIPEYGAISPIESNTSLDTPDARIENWKRQLLDLTMRNPLLNFTTRKRAIEINGC